MTTQQRLVAGRYRLDGVLGRGGMGTVWAARDEVLERRVAVKEVDVPGAADPAEAARLQDRVLHEARTAARIDHPGVVRVFDVVEDDGRPWIVMEVLGGRSLAEVLRDDGPLAPPRAAEVGLELLDALDAAHRLGIVHRDVKPGNVQLLENGRVVLTDFGIASRSSDATMTRTGEVVGSPAYMSPERARGEPLGAASDLFSLGATLYHAVEGHPPFERETPVATLTAVVHEQAAPMRSAGPLAPVLVGLLDKDPGQRWTAAAARGGLRRVLVSGPAAERTQALPLDATRPVPVDTTRRPPANHTQVLPPLVDPAPTPPPAAARQVPVGPPTPPHGTPMPRRRRRGPALAWGAGLAMLVAVALLAAVGTVLVRHERSASDGGQGPYSPGRGGVPADWVLQHGRGFDVATPRGWRRQQDGPVLRWRGDEPYRYIGVYSASGGDPRAVLDRASASWGDSHEDYQDGGVRDTTFRGQRAATWDLTYRDQVDLRARLTAVLLDGRVWVLWWQTRPDGWDSLTAERDHVESSFRTTR